MNDLIAGIAKVQQSGQKFTVEEEVALENALNELFQDIHRYANVEAANSSLDQLGYFQTELARACFKWKIQLSPKLRQLVREFDRSDDPDLRLAIFNRIKQDTFLASREGARFKKG